MKKVIRTFNSFEEAEKADTEYYRSLSGEERLRHFFQLITSENPNEATIERCARTYSITKQE